MTYERTKLIKYLVPDFEYRKDNSGNWVLCAVAFLGLNKYFKISFEQIFYFKDSLKCQKFVRDKIGLDLYSESHYMANLRSLEDCLHYLFHALMNGKDGNIELIGHNIKNFDLPRFEKIMHDHGYPFWWNDKGYEKEISEGLFCHHTHDTRDIAEGCRAIMNFHNIKTKVTLDSAAEIFGIHINEERRHEPSYDCWLAAEVFIRDKFEKSAGLVFKNYIKRAADNSDYISSEIYKSSMDK